MKKIPALINELLPEALRPSKPPIAHSGRHTLVTESVNAGVEDSVTQADSKRKGTSSFVRHVRPNDKTLSGAALGIGGAIKEMRKLTRSVPPSANRPFAEETESSGSSAEEEDDDVDPATAPLPSPNPAKAKSGTPRPPAGAQHSPRRRVAARACTWTRLASTRGPHSRCASRAVRFFEPLQSGDKSDSAALQEAGAHDSNRKLSLQSCIKEGSSSSSSSSSSGGGADKENVVVTSGQGGKQVHLHLHFN
jgi:hypothetical protein